MLCLSALTLAGVTPARAQANPSPVVKAADAVLVRPVCFAATTVSTALFILGLPITAALKKTKPAAQLLVVHPMKATFTRPLGDLDAMGD